MDLAFIAKLICDLMLWYGTAGFVLSSYGVTLSFKPPLIIVLVSALSAFLYGKKPVFRYLPLPFLLLSLYSERSFVGLMLIVPPLFYSAWLCYDARFSPDYDKSAGYFKTTALSMLGICFIALLANVAFAAISLRYLLIFLFSGVIMLRLLRHDEQNRRELRLQLIDLILLVLLCAVALFFSSNLFLSAAAKTLSFIYQNLVEPLLYLITYIFLMLFMLLLKLLSLLKIGKPGEAPDIQIPNVREMLNLDPNFQGAKSETLEHLLTFLGIVVFIVLAFIVFRRIAAGRSEQKSSSTGSDSISFVPEVRPSIFSAFAPRTPRETVRLFYRRFLKNAEKKGIKFGPGDTSERIERLCLRAYEPALLSELRNIYISARYSPYSVTREDAVRMKEVYSKLMKANKQAKPGS